MVRFARAEGSRGCNKRVLEEATPWSEMMVHHDTTKKRKKEALAPGEASVGGQAKERKKKTKKSKVKEEGGSVEGKEGSGQTLMMDVNEMTDGVEVKKGIDLEKEGECSDQNAVLVQQEEQLGEKDKSKRKRKKKKGKENASELPKEFVINAQGQRVKVFRDGTERTWFDLPYEDGERMTRYDNMWVKREMAGKLDQLKESLKDQNLGDKQVMRTMMKAKRKAHRELRIELIYEQKRLVSEQKQQDEGGSGSVDNHHKATHKKGKKRKKLNLDREEPTKVNKVSKFENDDHLRKEEDSKEQKKLDLDREEPTKVNKVSKVENDGHLRKEEESKDMMETSNDIVWKSEEKSPIYVSHTTLIDKKSLSCHNGQQSEPSVDREDNRKHSMQNNEQQPYSHVEKETFFQDGEDFSRGEKNMKPLEFQEDDLMTQYDGFWVRKDAVEHLNTVKEEKQNAILSARTNGTTEQQLTAGEQVLFQRAMKKEKRFEHRKLVRELAKRDGVKKHNRGGARDIGGSWQHNDARQLFNNDKSGSDEVVKFDGFWVKKESADRLRKLKEKLESEGLSEEELRTIMQKERRKEERVLKTERKLVCLKCRQPGHMVSACPQLDGNDSGGQLSICYSCGSTEHTVRDCNLKREGAEFSHASCYICGESGHISRQCPDNPRGLYPNGGACRGCGSVEHLARNCPDMKEEQEKETVWAERLDGTQVEALDALPSPPPALTLSKSKRKVKEVKF